MKDFLSQFKTWAHWFAGAALSAAVLYGTNDAVHKAVNQALTGAPKIAGFVASVAAILLAYSNSKKQ